MSVGLNRSVFSVYFSFFLSFLFKMLKLICEINNKMTKIELQSATLFAKFHEVGINSKTISLEPLGITMARRT